MAFSDQNKILKKKSWGRAVSDYRTLTSSRLFLIFLVTPCLVMAVQPCNGCSALYGVNPNFFLKKETQYSVNFSRSNIKFCLSLHYNGSSSFLLVNATKNISIQSKRFWNKKYPLCLGNISGDFSANKMKKKTKKQKKNRIKWLCVRFFCWL